MSGHPADDADDRKPSVERDLERTPPSSDPSTIARRASLAFAAVAALATTDLVSDVGSGIDPKHVVLEGALLAIAVVALWRMRRAVQRTGTEVETLRGQVEAWRAQAERWRGEARVLLEGLGAAMDAQFARWELSPAEREVALLLVKGLSSNEIATVRATSERTVRQQSQAVYRKAGLGGRAELAAFFLEDLLLPGSLPTGAAATPRA